MMQGSQTADPGSQGALRPSPGGPQAIEADLGGEGGGGGGQATAGEKDKTG